MATTQSTEVQSSDAPCIDPADHAIPCVDLSLDYAPETLFSDFEAWCAARDATTTTLLRVSEQ